MNLEFYLKKVDLLADGLGHPIDLGIKKPVANFLYKNYETTASCQGHLDWGLPFPWIDFMASARDPLEKILISSKFANKFSIEWFGHQQFKEFRFRGKGCGLHCQHNCKYGFGALGKEKCKVSAKSLAQELQLMTKFSEWILQNV